MAAKPSRKKESQPSQGTPPSQLVWSFGVNEPCPDIYDQALKQFSPTHHVKADFSALCDLFGVVPHPGLAAPKKGLDEESECQSLAVQSTLMDLASARVLRYALPTATQLQILRLSSCRLDIEMLSLLRLGISDGTVHTLHIDWNPVEVPLEAEALKSLPAEDALEALDELERKCMRKQAERELRAFSAQLQASTASNLDEALQKVATVADPDYPATAMLKPLDMGSFTAAVRAHLDLPDAEVERIFQFLDMPSIGSGDGSVSFARVKELLTGLPQLSQDEELNDPIGTAFASFLDGTSVLEAVSFRYCNLGCTEVQAFGKALKLSQHLRALNLWGNRICDRGAAALAGALEHYFGLQYLGLGRNFVTHIGLERLCKVLGVTRIDSKEQADPLMKQISQQTKDRDKKFAKSPPVPKQDKRGRERYMPESYHIDRCEEQKDPVTNQAYWVWTRNVALRTLVLDHNPVTDADAVRRLQPFGVGDLALRGTPCAEVLRAEQQAAASSPTPSVADAEPEAPQPVLSPTGGWRLVLA